MKSTLLLLAPLLFSYFAVAQLVSNTSLPVTQLPTLSKQQMYQDYDTLVKTLTAVSPQSAFRKKLTGFDITVFYKKNRQKISKITRIEDFYQLLRSTLTANQDAHTSMVSANLIPATALKQIGISDAAIRYYPLYSEIYKSPAAHNHLNFEFRYLNGKYYSMVPFIYKNKNYKKGLELVACNGKPINTYVNELYPNLILKWDNNTHRYFADNFFKAFNLLPKDNLNLTFKGYKIASTFNVSDSVKLIDYQKSAESAIKKVIYLPGVETLYIRMPAMTVADSIFYRDEILQHKKEKISKVVFDIRGNRGGGDGVWRNALSAIISKPIIIDETIVMNKNPKIKQIFAGQFDSSKTVNVTFLNNKPYYIFYKGKDTIANSKSSIQFGGKIYILQDKNIYSSAGSFATVGNMDNNFYTVGEVTGAQLGIGINPAVFELPNSKIVYRVEPVIDFSGVKKPADILHDHVKIPVSTDLNRQLELLNSSDRNSTTFLLQKDPYFKAAINN